jgi:S-ribosylhomocysteine lyase LuxS involved in autoinducer biosynthesis
LQNIVIEVTPEMEVEKLKTIQLESFSLDHTRIKAPYVRLSKRVEVPGSGYEISTFDFRVRTPNT